LINFLQHRSEVIGNFCNTFKKLAYKTIWGIDLNCNVLLPEFAWMAFMILRYQQLSDCCAQCTSSHMPQDCVISQRASLNPNPKFPFVQLSICNQPTNCKYTGVGDFNSDFNSDFFK